MDKLRTAEKDKVLSLYKEKKTVKSIARELKRPEEMVQNYLDEIRALFAIDSKIKSGIDARVIQEVTDRLFKDGMANSSIVAKINKISKELTKAEMANVTTELLYNKCKQLMGAGDLMINKQGITIMTEEASEKSDAKNPTVKDLPHTYKIF